MTTLEIASRVPFGIRFSLDDYTNWWNSPHAAVLFWSVFVVVILAITALTLWTFRRRAGR
jgi:hypothetical protein